MNGGAVAPHRTLCSAAAVRPSTAIRVAAVTALAAGLAAPLVRRRLKLPPPVVTATAATAPIALCVLVPRSRARDVGTCILQMWAYLATYKMPNDDPEALERRVRIAYPVKFDTWLGRGILELDQPFHPIGLAGPGAEDDGLDMSIFAATTPPYADVVEVRAHGVGARSTDEVVCWLQPDDATECSGDPDRASGVSADGTKPEACRHRRRRAA